MSKTHKITQLKKRIAELEKKLNRREDVVGGNPVRCLIVDKVRPITIKTERHLSTNVCNMMRVYPEKQEHVARMLLMELAESEDFARTARVEFKSYCDFDDTVRARAAIQVLPYYGDIWED